MHSFTGAQRRPDDHGIVRWCVFCVCFVCVLCVFGVQACVRVREREGGVFCVYACVRVREREGGVFCV